MFMPHMGAQSVRTVFSAPRVGYDRNGKPADIWGLNGSASVNGKTITLTVTNPHLTDTREATINIRGAKVASAKARVLSTKDVHAHNTFNDPRAVEPHDETVTASGDSIVFKFAPASVTQFQLTLV
jgi:alpha-N-arabinofuranosidase